MAELLLAKEKIMPSYRLEDYDFVSLSKHAKKRRVHERLLILAHVKTGKTLTQAADALFVGKPVVKRCLKNFFSKGLKGLEDKPRSGRPTRLAAAHHHKDLITLIEASYTSASGGRLTGQDIADLIEEKWQVRYTVNGVYE
jgi:transposase